MRCGDSDDTRRPVHRNSNAKGRGGTARVRWLVVPSAFFPVCPWRCRESSQQNRINTVQHTFSSSSLPFFFTKFDTYTKRQKRERSLGSQKGKGGRYRQECALRAHGGKQKEPQWRRKGKEEEEWSWILEKLLRAAEDHKQGQKDCRTAECAEIRYYGSSGLSQCLCKAQGTVGLTHSWITLGESDRTHSFSTLLGTTNKNQSAESNLNNEGYGVRKKRPERKSQRTELIMGK